MQKSKRMKAIKNYLQQHKDVQISELTDIIEASESTIRRDIKELAKEGFLVELYGSIVLNQQNDPDTLLNRRLGEQVAEKSVIGEKAAQKIKNNDFIYIDAGSTTYYMLRFIQAHNITIVTNGLNIAIEASRLNFSVYMVGGEVKYITTAIVGEQAIQSIQKYHFDKCFMGVNGYNDESYTTPEIREGSLKHEVIKHSNVTYVLADTSKYNKQTNYAFASRDEGHLINEG
ncbi:MAG: DeoR/GlpR family DNA-binding transcription regulator [Candidatus Izemoplasma sp.]|nr:DeoR/GlpR family DNA-binding transcription regulator [Candidatus Izemoplasma sp.]